MTVLVTVTRSGLLSTFRQRGGGGLGIRREEGKCAKHYLLHFTDGHLRLQNPYPWRYFPQNLSVRRRHDIVTEKNMFGKNEWQLLSFRPRNSLLTAARIS